ncbi:hypothetical protein NQZ68_027807 [Dissostichus eleginoides]|nr:hypothetical protein NQZ68_027807 [Dissostichus eleginoides]
MRGPLCPCLPVLCPMVHGALLGQVPDRLDPLFAHYSHYLASNQCRTGCWDLSTTHKGPGSLAGLPASDPIRKMEAWRRVACPGAVFSHHQQQQIRLHLGLLATSLHESSTLFPPASFITAPATRAS